MSSKNKAILVVNYIEADFLHPSGAASWVKGRPVLAVLPVASFDMQGCGPVDHLYVQPFGV